MKVIDYAVIIIMFFILTGCSTSYSIRNRSVPPAEDSPILGVAVMNSSGPFSVTPAIDTDTKTGSAVAYSILGLVSFGDAGSAKASKNGKIDIIKDSNVQILKVVVLKIPIFTRFTTVVSGK